MKKQHSILIVDDNQELAFSLKDILENEGCHTAIANDGQTAINICREQEFDIGLIDIKLPDIQGIELIDKLSSLTPKTEYVIITGHASIDTALAAVRDNKILGYEQKPIDMDRFLTLFRQISGRKQAEENLEKEARMRTTLLDNVPDCIALIIKKGTREIVASNRFARELGAVPGQTCFKTCFMRDNNCPWCLAPKLWNTGQSQKIEIEYMGAWYEGSFAPLSEDLYVHYIFDITERKLAEAEREKLEAQNRQLQKAESLDRMAGAIAHHFNNQLCVVIGNLELAMMNKLSGTSGLDKFLTAAMKSADKAAEMSGLMLTYLGQTYNEQDPLDLSGTCRLSLRILGAATPKNVVINNDLPSPGPTVEANENQIKQVLTNLVTNAWEAMGDGRGAIHLTVKTVSPADIPASHRFPVEWKPQENDYACLEVADTGCGIADKDIDKLFDPFYSSKFTGRGLGLPVVLGFVRAHSGVVTVESESGKGSIFKVFLPVSAEEVSRQPESVQGNHIPHPTDV